MLSKKQDYTIADVKAYVQDISKANDSKELNLVELGFKIANDGAIVAELPGSSKKYDLCKNATMDLCRNLKIPYSYYNIISPELKLKNINSRLNSVKPTLRRVEYNEEHDVIRGFVPKSYSRLSNSTLLDSFDPDLLVRPLKSYESDLDLIIEKDLSLRVLLGELDIPTDSSPNHFGLNVNMSELGGFFSIKPLLYRQICSNGAIIQSNTGLDPYKISYSTLDTVLATSLLGGLVRAWSAKTEKFNQRLNELTETNLNLDELMEGLKKEKVPITFLNKLHEDVVGREITNWEFFNLVTNKAQDMPENQIRIEQAISSAYGLVDLYLN